MTQNDILVKIETLEQKVAGHDDKIMVIFEYLHQLVQSRQQQEDQANRKRIGFRQD